MYPKIAKAVQKAPGVIEAFGEDNSRLFTINGYLHSFTPTTVLAKPTEASEIAYVYDFEGQIRCQRSV